MTRANLCAWSNNFGAVASAHLNNHSIACEKARRETMKQKIPMLLALLAFIAIADLISSMPSRASAEPSASVAAQKGKVAATVEAVDLDAGIAPLTGKRVMYVLTDAEGGASLEATGQGRKVPAVITYNYRGKR